MMQSYILNLIAGLCSIHLPSLYYIKYRLLALVFNISMVVIDRLSSQWKVCRLFFIGNIMYDCLVYLTYISRSKLYSYQPIHRYKCIKALGGWWVDRFNGITKFFAWMEYWWLNDVLIDRDYLEWWMIVQSTLFAISWCQAMRFVRITPMVANIYFDLGGFRWCMPKKTKHSTTT